MAHDTDTLKCYKTSSFYPRNNKTAALFPQLCCQAKCLISALETMTLKRWATDNQNEKKKEESALSKVIFLENTNFPDSGFASLVSADSIHSNSEFSLSLPTPKNL